MADRFDNDGSGSVSIKEMQAALNALSRGEALPEARTDPTPQIIVDNNRKTRRTGSARRATRVTEMRRSRECFVAQESALFAGTRAPTRPEGFDARLDNFLAKLSGRVAAPATEAHARDCLQVTAVACTSRGSATSTGSKEAKRGHGAAPPIGST